MNSNKIKRFQTGLDMEQKENEEDINVFIDILPDGAMIIRGTVKVRFANGETRVLRNINSFCRCGNSGNKPFCDGSHYGSGYRD